MTARVRRRIGPRIRAALEPGEELLTGAEKIRRGLPSVRFRLCFDDGSDLHPSTSPATYRELAAHLGAPA